MNNNEGEGRGCGAETFGDSALGGTSCSAGNNGFQFALLNSWHTLTNVYVNYIHTSVWGCVWVWIPLRLPMVTIPLPLFTILLPEPLFKIPLPPSLFPYLCP